MDFPALWGELVKLSPYAVILVLAGLLFIKIYDIGIKANKEMAKEAVAAIKDNSDNTVREIRSAYDRVLMEIRTK